jgi:hypothetical protein
VFVAKPEETVENRPTIRISAIRVQPEYEDRYYKWFLEVYAPLLVNVPGVKGWDFYQILKENPQYPRRIFIPSYANRTEQVSIRNNPILIDVTQDLATTWASRSESIWYPCYELIDDFKNQAIRSEQSALSDIEIAPVIHLEGYSLTAEEKEKFETWFTKWGNELYIPWLMKLSGLIEYAHYRLIDVDLTTAPGRPFFNPRRPVTYPPYLSILRFVNIEAYESYEKSIELAGFRDHMKVPFPAGLDFKWYVQYQLVKSFRK